ncbi:MAG: TIGR01777 family oxidoreductase [Chloroflexi bacterium]|nr:TIGR01777 family oxidoreductase [Chloroflexota bacterium]MCI0648468.1 TIGR01777 family oxidoreductase [Chloroflexota bacterium]MCI0726649.1 TIGR01777 family oxidoreductase [Chloroflexota bacterium]
MRVIITGGTGSLGSRLANSLVQDGHEVVVLSRNPQKHQGDQPAGIRLLQWDAQTAEGWASAADGAAAIVNFAGENLAGEGFLPDRWTHEKKRKIRESRLNAGRAVVQAVEAASQKPGLVVQASAVGYYGPCGDEIVTEETPPGNDFLATLCVEWEASTAPVEKMGVRQVIVRTGLVLDRHNGPLPRMLLPYKLFAGGPYGSGRQWWPWVHPADEIGAIRFLMATETATGPYNLTAPNPVTNREFGRVLGRVLGRPSWLPVPAFAMRLLVGETATVALDGQRAISKRLQELGYTFQFSELEAALRDLLR